MFFLSYQKLVGYKKKALQEGGLEFKNSKRKFLVH